jgi:GMP synthase (glutamine-hydrolysing)
LTEVVLVVDFGAQYAQLIARRVREARVYSEIVRTTITAAEVQAKGAKGIILSGGPSSVYAEGAPTLDKEIFELGIPILGICYGAQLLAQSMGGTVAATGRGGYGRAAMTIHEDSALTVDFPKVSDVWMSHGDSITELPSHVTVLASSEDAPVALFGDTQARAYGVQFHPEVQHSVHGQDLIERFLHDVCGLPGTWTHASIIETQVAAIKTQVGTQKVLCALSGGVDSAVAAALVHKAVGDQLTCVFVDTGLMRKGEGDQIDATFREHFQVDLIHVQAEDRYFEALAGVTDPERKRKIIGELFIRIFEEVARELGAGTGDEGPKFLVQGTLYPDVIESGSGHAANIKSHHNVGGLPEDLDFDLVEPLRALFKDEVRAVGEELGLPSDLVWRQPFPGPGLGVRIIGEVTKERAEILANADHVVLEEIRRAGLYRDLWQSFAILPAVRTVGVMGDGRTYAYPIIIRAVTSDDAMTADWARLPYDLLERIANRLINEVDGVNRVALDITSKPPGTIEWE